MAQTDWLGRALSMAMESKKPIRLKVASPCNADWNSMKGDDAVRHCGSCSKNVYQLSNMSTEQVEELLLSQAGDLCGRFYQRKDGTLMTSDCAVGVRRKRRKQAVLGAGMGVLSAIGVSLGAASSSTKRAPEIRDQQAEQIPNISEIPVLDTPVVEPVVEPVPVPDALEDEVEVDEEEYYPIMGKIAYRPEVDFGLPDDEPVEEPVED